MSASLRTGERRLVTARRVGDGRVAFDTAASCLRLRGGFNVNSTSVQAWRALLAGHRDLEVSGLFRHPFSRFVAPSGTANAALEGHRLLSDDQIETLAEKIRDEVLARGPFLSLADFVNRRLAVRGHDPAVLEDERPGAAVDRGGDLL